MTTVLIIMILSAVGGILFTISSLTLNLNAQSYRKPRAYPFVMLAFSSLFLFHLQQGYRLKELPYRQVLRDGLHPASQNDVTVMFSFLAAALLLLLLAYYLNAHSSDLKGRLPGTLSRVRFYTAMLTIFVSLSAIPCLGFVSTFSFLFFPGWVFSRSLPGRMTVLKAAGMGALSCLIGTLPGLPAPTLPAGLLPTVALLFITAIILIRLKERVRISYGEK